jgi:hypothetical protein
MRMRHAIVLVGVLGCASAASAQEFRIDEVSSARAADVAQLVPGTIAFSDHAGGSSADSSVDLLHFEDWARTRPVEKRFLALFPSYVEPDLGSHPDSASAKSGLQKLYVYVAQARFVLDRAPGAIDLPHYVTLEFLQRIDPAIKHKTLAAADVGPFTDEAGAGNDNPDRKWCTGRPNLVCIQSVYRLEGKIPLGVMLVNKLRDSAKKIADHIDFQSEFSALLPADVDQDGLKELTALGTPVSGVLEQSIFHVNEIMKFGRFVAVFQAHPTDPGKTVVTAFMALAIEASVLDKKREYENVPVLRNLVPAEVLMGRSSFNSGSSISAGLPKYARNEIAMVAGILQHDKGK